ncbi:DNA replication regulator SLD3-domain-containing protein [Xylaria sp. CBS 124048]|nr:DNA replication regulator SLD3-domain-containing protein [Xylaria sp. CBS 124048]
MERLSENSHDQVGTSTQDSDTTRFQLQSTPASTDDSSRRDRGSKSRAKKPECSEHSDSFPTPSSAMEELLRPQIVIKPHPPKLTVKPRSLQPLMLLPRECLRLSFLALSSPYGSFEPSPAFESTVRILDLESRMGNRPVVLIARLESNKTLYAIERQANAFYTLCHLGSWVDLDELCRLATVSSPTLIHKAPPIPGSDPIAAVPLTTPQISHTNKKRKLAIESIQSLVKRSAKSRAFSLGSQFNDGSRPPTPIQGSNTPDVGIVVVGPETPSIGNPALTPSAARQAGAVQDEDEALDTPNAEGILNSVRDQYFEALYHSMGSLAYFAKGPLSRARAAFQFDCDPPLEMCDLIEFLKSLVMTTAQIDKKYRETIPKLLSELRHDIQDSDAESKQAKGKLKKRKPKKMKLGKDGLYPNEDSHIRRWRAIHKPSLQSDSESTMKSIEQGEKLQISLLRSRETQLQMIIILEILGLEPLLVRENTNAPQLPGQPAEEPSESPKVMPTKKRNKHNFPFLLDVHVDRLCIWQSTALDEFHAMNQSQAGSGQDLQNSLKPTSDPLKDFCVDIIMPFFAARLPEHCNSINKKLGGPVMLPPPKSKEKETEPLSKAKSRPGTAAKRPASRPNQTLENFLSKETERNRRSISRGPGGVIALMRSATTPTIPLIKREASESTSVMSIPKADTGRSLDKNLPAAGSALAKRSTETKKRRDAFVKAELRDAITSLRKPNRDVVEKAIVEADERRAATSLSQLKKSKKPTQYKAPNVVKATPVRSRFRDVLAKGHNSQPASLDRFGTIAEEPTLPSSSIVPSSAPRKRARAIAFESEPTAKPTSTVSATDRIMATPVRPSTLKNSFFSAPQPDEGVVLGSSPAMPRKLSQPSFLNRTQSGKLDHQDSGIACPSSPAGLDVLAETPIKARRGKPITSMTNYVTVTPVKKMMPGNEDTIAKDQRETKVTGHDKEEIPKKKVSIFERLGWDDYSDDLV